MVFLWNINRYTLQGKMIRKAILQGTVTSFIFFLSWFALRQINWMQMLKVENTKSSLEEKLGDIFSDVFRNSDQEINNAFILNTIDSLLSVICTENDIIKNDIRLHVLHSDEVNAFALPDRHMIINTGLINASANQEELCGVICHELAHIESGHVMKKLVKEIGLNMLVSMTSTGGAETIRNAAGVLSSAAYDRSLEEDADRLAVTYLMNSGIDAGPFASFIYSISGNSDSVQGLSWISTHPDPEERAMKILDYCVDQVPGTQKIISEYTWTKLIDEIDSVSWDAQACKH